MAPCLLCRRRLVLVYAVLVPLIPLPQQDEWFYRAWNTEHAAICVSR